jgi:hypothetical protein
MIFVSLTEEEATIVIDSLRSERDKLLKLCGFNPKYTSLNPEIQDISTAILKIQDQIFWTQPQSRIH